MASYVDPIKGESQMERYNRICHEAKQAWLVESRIKSLAWRMHSLASLPNNPMQWRLSILLRPNQSKLSSMDTAAVMLNSCFRTPLESSPWTNQ
uniref:Uncharacterized protein n=1 Tax=Physcomitrium patens TaxID=3218 RepID=A0A2K1IDN9_PHYPA|nr:hypothetical protein PHYPA_029550 [Physcomitrium patens]